MMKSIALTMRELSKREQLDGISKDMVSYMILAMRLIHESVIKSISAWEKRGYWVKADRFQIEWGWCDSEAEALNTSLVKNDWNEIIRIVVSINKYFSGTTISKSNQMGEPWTGAWEKLCS